MEFAMGGRWMFKYLVECGPSSSMYDITTMTQEIPVKSSIWFEREQWDYHSQGSFIHCMNIIDS